MPKKTLRRPYKAPPPRLCRSCGREVRKRDLDAGMAEQLDSGIFLCTCCLLSESSKMHDAVAHPDGHPHALREIPDTRQVAGEPERRWFTNGDIDLIVWNEKHRISGFQLVFPSDDGHTALTWRDGTGVSAAEVDDGEDRPARHKMTPVLTGTHNIDAGNALRIFRGVSGGLPPELTALVENTLEDLARRKTPEKEDKIE